MSVSVPIQAAQRGRPVGLNPLPKKKMKASPVYLPLETWAALDEIADFHSDVFAAIKDAASSSVSRNDIIKSLLDWGIAAYWKQVDGRPETKSERDAKVKKHAEALGRGLQEK